MAMSVGESAVETPMSDINTTPLVDVMLVLLIIFLIAVPVAIQTVKVNLPEVTFDPTTTKPENVSLSVRAGANGQCEVFWNQSQVRGPELVQLAVEKLKAEIARQGGIGNPELELPEAHIRGDVATPYRCIGGTIYQLQMAGFQKIGFISLPPAPDA